MLLIKVLILIVSIHYGQAESRLSSLRFPIVFQNRIIDVNASCNATNMNITLIMEKPFKGLLSAKDFAQECRSIGSKKNFVNINLSTSGCGVRMTANSSDQTMYYSVMLVAQQDRLLRQVTDQETMVRCRLRDSVLQLKSVPMFDAVKTEVNQVESKDSRKSRMRPSWKASQMDNESEKQLNQELEDVLGASRAWMEISPVEIRHSNQDDKVQVGEPTLLSVKSTLPVGIGWRVVDCTAHDGIGEISQRLLDAHGCPLDVTILPGLVVTEPRMLVNKRHRGDAIGVTTMRHQEAVTSFPAFKFPDRERLHVTCALQLCRGKCLQVECDENGENSTRTSRRLVKKGEEGEILDRFEVFNSVEVHAPGIELEDPRNPDLDEADGTQRFTPNLHIPGDRAFCVSPNKMALAFCILGVVFVVAVVVALCSLMRARRTGNTRMPYYTGSLFSSSSGGSAYGGSKLLLHESPTIGQTRHWRIL